MSRFDHSPPEDDTHGFFGDVAFGAGEVVSEVVSDVLNEVVSEVVSEAFGLAASGTESSTVEQIGAAAGPIESAGARGVESLDEAPDPASFGTAPDPDAFGAAPDPDALGTAPDPDAFGAAPDPDADTVVFGTAPPDESLDDDDPATDGA